MVERHRPRWRGEPDGTLALGLASTVRGPDGPDDVVGAADLSSWLDRHAALLGPVDPEVGLRVADFRALRSEIRALFLASISGEALPADAVRRVNDASAAVPVHLRLDLADPREPVAALAGGGGSRASEVLAAIARSAIAVVGGPERSRLSRCPASGCGRFFVSSRPGRVWCSDACGNRARVARHVARAGRSTVARRP